MSANWFVAFPVPAGTWHARVLAVPPPDAMRLFSAEDLHSTFAFLGAAPREAAERAWAIAARTAASTPAIDTELGAIVPMGKPRHWTALSATMVGDGHDRLVEVMQGSRAAILEAAGARPDLRPPLPHVTVARPSRRAGGRERTAALRWAEAIDVRGERVRIDRLALYTWAEDRKTRLFRIVAEAPLAG